MEERDSLGQLQGSVLLVLAVKKGNVLTKLDQWKSWYSDSWQCQQNRHSIGRPLAVGAIRVSERLQISN